MRQDQFARAEEELSRMLDAEQRLRRSRDEASSRQAWQDLLNHSQRMYNFLTAALKGSAAERTWSRDRQDERKSDPLLQYVQQARHADEHGLQLVVEPHSTAYIMPDRAGSARIRRVAVMNDGTIIVDGEDHLGNPLDPLEIVALNFVRIVPVVKRGVTYPVPSAHLGSVIEHNNIAMLARHITRHTEGVISGAKQFLVS